MRLPKAFSIVASLVLMASMLLAGCSQAPPEVPKLGAGYYPGTLTSALPNYPFPLMTFTATAQTKTQALSGQACLTLTMTATALTTATWIVNVSNDGGATYVPARVAPFAATLTPAITAVTTTAVKPYLVNVSGWTNYEIVTSGTFTATAVNFQGVASSNPCPSF
jgi:hypothetical protein